MENNWTIEQTKQLFKKAGEAREKGKGLSCAFAEMSKLTGRSVNSVRNYYYSQLKMFELVPKLATDLGIKVPALERERFELFDAREIENLIERVLCGKAQGNSVRKTIADMADGNAKYALRLQNKYRSMVLHHRDKVTEIMRRLSSSGVDYYNPYIKETVVAGSEPDNYRKLNDYISSLDEAEVGEFLNLLRRLGGAK